MHRIFSAGFLAVLMAFSSACSNPCQSICSDMADYAKDCGFTVTDGELDACMDDFKSSQLPDGQKDVCREYGDSLREEWNCQDVGAYFGE